jgi:hypothetical protein
MFTLGPGICDRSGPAVRVTKRIIARVPVARTRRRKPSGRTSWLDI